MRVLSRRGGGAWDGGGDPLGDEEMKKPTNYEAQLLSVLPFIAMYFGVRVYLQTPLVIGVAGSPLSDRRSFQFAGSTRNWGQPR